jgi:hypothetical protein
MLGLSTSAFTVFHVALSLIGIAAGVFVVAGMLGSRSPTGWTAAFLGATVATSVTGFFFPHDQVLPSHIVGALSLVVLAVAILALYRYRLGGPWRWIYVITAIAAMYLNVFVAAVQAFLKMPFLHALAPTQSAPPFVIAQLIVLVAFVALGVVAVKAFHPQMPEPALRPQ